ncbi:MAG: preprotein translocase subunit SecF [Abditibacteriota bacterium]|jgi:preprotein translocase subunit SecF|nr:preprotein translocase subunit SecF [Abditibacteriota bacterium]
MDFRGRKIDLVGKLPLWFGLSTIVIIIGLISLAAFKLNLGVDFRGGSQLQYRIPQAQRADAGTQVTGAIADRLEERGIGGARVQVTGGDTLVVQTTARSESELAAHERAIDEALAAQWKVQADSITPLSRELVGPVIGDELRANAIKGVIMGVLMIALWIYIRYNFAGDGLRYAVAGIVALVHDVFVLLGIFALIGRIDPRVEIDGAFIAALLTVVGYSINDSVVIFDRIRENLRNRRKEPFNTVVNDSLLETMSRSINTGLTVIIMLVVLLFLGGESIYNFVLAMLVGIVSGLYSSIFNASMVLVAWHNWDEKKAAQARASRGTGRTVTARDASVRPGLSAATAGATSSGASASRASASLPRPSAALSGNASSVQTSSANNLEQKSGPVDSSSELDAPSAGNSTVAVTDMSSTQSEAARAAAAKASRKARSKRRY